MPDEFTTTQNFGPEKENPEEAEIDMTGERSAVPNPPPEAPVPEGEEPDGESQ